MRPWVALSIADDGDELSVAQLQVHVFQRMNGGVSFAEGLPDPGHLDSHLLLRFLYAGEYQRD